ncbi:MAG TPA: helix-turn-helix transcriptional regulator [Puia sp.]|nr:helix-turn-helix transcriptional regulator [Puia sp.]
MIRYAYHFTDYRTWLTGFAKLLSLRVNKKVLQIPPYLGEGYIYASAISEDISFGILNFSLKDDLVFIRKKSDYGISLLFSQVEVSSFFKVSDQHNVITDKAPMRSNIFLSSTNYELEAVYSKNSTLKIVGILFSPQFIRKVLKKDILLDIMLYTGERLRNVNKVPITFEYRKLLDDIFSMDMQQPISHLVLQNRILLLTEKFLTTFLEKRFAVNSQGRKTREQEKDIKALKEIEKILSSPNLEKFPSIEMLSKTAMMSSTKLKTKFKKIYGVKLYEFYNRNRLEKAKEMLQSGEYSVKEVGHDIGFSNLSNFAKAFKKEFGVLPNKMLRS